MEKEKAYRLKKIAKPEDRSSRVYVGRAEQGHHIEMHEWLDDKGIKTKNTDLNSLSDMKLGQQFRIWDGRIHGGITTSPVSEIFSKSSFKEIKELYEKDFVFGRDDTDEWALDPDCPINRKILKKEYFKTETSIYELTTFEWEDTRG